MRAELFYHRTRFSFQNGEVTVLVGVVVAGEHKFLPHEYALAVAGVVERRFHQSRAAPHAQNVHVRLARGDGVFGAPFVGNNPRENIWADEV